MRHKKYKHKASVRVLIINAPPAQVNGGFLLEVKIMLIMTAADLVAKAKKRKQSTQPPQEAVF